MNLAELYQTILAATRTGARGLRRFTTEEWRAISENLNSSDPVLLHQAIFLSVHSSTPDRELESVLIKLMQAPLPTEDVVWLLNSVRKHIIQGRFKDGDRLTHEFLEALKTMLHHKDGAVVEWVLRTIEECGAQAIVFRSELAKIKPSPWSLWRAQSRTILELVTFIERKWSTRERS